jgi:putative transposase
LKKAQAIGPIAARRALIEPRERPSILEHCDLLDVSRTSYYYTPCPETEENLALMG